MNQQVKNLIAQQGQDAAKSSIVKSIRDLKTYQYTKEEIKETLLDMYGEYFLDFINSQLRTLF